MLRTPQITPQTRRRTADQPTVKMGRNLRKPGSSPLSASRIFAPKANLKLHCNPGALSKINPTPISRSESPLVTGEAQLSIGFAVFRAPKFSDTPDPPPTPLAAAAPRAATSFHVNQRRI